MITLRDVILYSGDASLLSSYWLLGRKNFIVGWLCSFLGSVCFVIGGLWIHQPSIWALNICFLLIAARNFYKEFNA